MTVWDLGNGWMGSQPCGRNMKKKFVADHFDESCLDEIELENDNTSFVTYNPTGFGKQLALGLK